MHVSYLSVTLFSEVMDFLHNMRFIYFFQSTIEMIIKYIKMKDPNSLSFVLAVMDNVFERLYLQDFHTRTVHELLWGYEDAQLSQAYGILVGLAKSRDPTFNIELPRKFAMQVCMPR